jgi:hypothetical protein
MSNDLVDQFTLDCLVSRPQLQKLNQRLKETKDKTKLNEIEKWKDRIENLFKDLLVNNPPDDILFEVKSAFDNFIDKSIYYFKAHDNCINLEKEREDYIIKDDIDYDKEERMIEQGNYVEQSFEADYKADYKSDNEAIEDADNEAIEEADDEAIEEDDDEAIEENTTNICSPVIVKKKIYKKNYSKGVEDIHNLPFNWFQNVRDKYKQNKIIPRKKENIT